MEDLGKKLQELRKKNNLTQDELALKLNVSRQSISKWENNESLPDSANLIELAKVYNISLDELVSNNNETKKESNKNKKDKFTFITSLIDLIYTLIIVIIYLILGFSLKDGTGWKNYWFLFILIPVLPSLFNSIKEKRMSNFAFPLLVASIYCALGMNFNIWHPLWIIFFLIPIFYIISNLVDKFLLSKK